MQADDGAKRRDSPLAPAHYDGWSVSDFDQHLAALKAEVTRAEAARAARQASLAAASAFFRTPG